MTGPAPGFDTATAVTATEPGRYRADIDPRWTIAGKPNGGYLLATIARAAMQATSGQATDGVRWPWAVSAHYLSAPSPGPAGVEVRVLRSGRRASQVAATLSSEGRQCVSALLTLGPLDPAGPPWWERDERPSCPPPEDCRKVGIQGAGGVVVSFAEVVDVLLDPATAGFATGTPSGEGELRGWFRFADGRPPDPLSLLVTLDAFPPATIGMGVFGWAPTLEFTAYVRAVPAPGPLLVRQAATTIAGDLMDERCTVWDSGGRLVGSAVQLAGVRTGSATPPT